MPATRKINHVSQEQDLDQLKNIFGSSASNISSNISASDDESSKKSESSFIPEFEETSEAVKTENKKQVIAAAETKVVTDSNIITEEKKEVSDTTVGIRMTTAKKREMKAYFIQHGTTMSQGVLDAFTLLRKLEDKGIVKYKDGLLEISNA